ncbi:YjcZ family sporulation protein [Shouchella shacheensis]|nr:YjcZ family sporulation protein [Shouchella shacheensis]
MLNKDEGVISVQGGFAFIVVLFILLIIVGSAYVY